MSDSVRVLYVDDDHDFAARVATSLERADERFVVETATAVADGLDRLADDVDCIVSDYDLPDRTGLEFLEAVRTSRPDLPFVLYTDAGSERVASDAISAGVTEYLRKETETERFTALADAVADAVATRRLAAATDRRRHRLEQVLKTVPACVVQLNRDGEFVYANERAKSVLGLERDEVTDRTYNDPEWSIRDLDGEPIPDDELPFQQVLQSGAPVTDYRHTIRWPDGTERTLLVNGAPLFDTDGTVESVVFSLSDITEIRENERRLRQTGARLEALFEQSPDMINVHDSEGNILDPNPRLCERTGYSEAELTGMKVWDLDRRIDPDEAQSVWAEMDTGDRRRLDGEYRCRDGSSFPVEIHIRRLDLGGTPRFLVISRDITDRAERERELEVTQRQLEAILENTTTPMFMKDAEGRYIFVNRGYRELFDLDDEDIVGRTDYDIHPESMADEVRANDRAAIARGDPIETEERILVDGDQRVFLSTKVPLYDIGERADPDEPVGLFGVASDITAIKERERALQRERDRLDEFASIVSHDLRNPLTVAEGRLELAREDCDSPHLDGVADALDRGQMLINDLLTLARNGEEVDEMTPVPLADLVNDCWRGVETDGARLVLDVDEDLTVRADRSRLQQLLENLIRNGVEHGSTGSRSESDDGVEDGEVRIAVGALDDGFYVADDGPGIPESERETIFERGYSTAEEGTGFGLRIVEQIASAHGWSVRATESEDGGARFELTGVESPSDPTPRGSPRRD